MDKIERIVLVRVRFILLFNIIEKSFLKIRVKNVFFFFFIFIFNFFIFKFMGDLLYLEFFCGVFCFLLFCMFFLLFKYRCDMWVNKEFRFGIEKKRKVCKWV